MLAQAQECVWQRAVLGEFVDPITRWPWSERVLGGSFETIACACHSIKILDLLEAPFRPSPS